MKTYYHIDYDFANEKIKFFYGHGFESKMVSKYFQFQKKYFDTPYLDSLKILTKCDTGSSFFDIKICTPNQLGIPSAVINGKRIRCFVENGINANKIDISCQKIQFPEQGFFVIINWINTESNTFTFSYHKGKKDKERYIGTVLQPVIGAYPSEQSNSFILEENGWKEMQKSNSILNLYDNKYKNLAIEVILSS